MESGILIIGANGQLGWELAQTFPDATGLTREDLDVTDLVALRGTIRDISPDLIFNCTAYNEVDKAEAQRKQAIQLNATVPAVMASEARRVGASFFHFSTDYVFGGDHAHAIDESQQPAPISAYGRSKWLGEQQVMQNHPDAVIMRLTGVYSHRKNNFVKTMLKHAGLGNPLTVVNDQFVSPTWVRPIARSIAELVELDPPGGVIHAVARGGCTWYDMATKIFEILEIDADLTSVTQESWSAPADRPPYSVLDNMVLDGLRVDQHLVHWEEMLREFLDEYGADLKAEFFK